MAWIESHQTLKDHPKTLKAARILGVSPYQIIGHLMSLWWWAMDYAQDGDLTYMDESEIATAAGWTGDAEAFVDALVECRPRPDRHGFLERNGGTLIIHDWDKRRIHYESERNCRKYNEWRLSVFYRDDFTCQKCGKRGGEINAHHIIPWAENKELRFDVDNGTTLCRSCHKEEHKHRSKK